MQERSESCKSNRTRHDSQPVESVEVESNFVRKVTEGKSHPKRNRAKNTCAGRYICKPVRLGGRLARCLIDGRRSHWKHYSVALRVVRFSMRFMYRAPCRIASTKIPGVCT